MASREIQRTTFSDYNMNGVAGLPCIKIRSRTADASLISSVRALLFERVGEDDDVHIAVPRGLLLSNKQDISRVNSYIYDGLTILHVAYADFLDEVEAFFKDSGFVLSKKVSLFFDKRLRNCKIRCFINEKEQQTVLFTTDMNLSEFHMIQAGIPVYFPWYFKDKPLTDQEKQLIEALAQDDMDKYLEVIEQIAERIDIYKMQVKHMLGNFESSIEQRQCRQAEIRIDQLERELENYFNTIRQLNQERQMQAFIVSACKTCANKEPELMNYFLVNKNVKLVNVDDTCLSFVAMGDLSIFDPVEAQRMIDNPRSIFYNLCYSGNPIFTDERVRKFFSELFVNQSIRLRIAAEFCMDITGYIDSISGTDNLNISDGYLNNPHASHHSCLGDYRREIVELIERGDYISAVDQCIASATSLNLGDYAVMQGFIGDIMRCGKVFVLPDGTEANLEDAVLFIAKEEETNGTQN